MPFGFAGKKGSGGGKKWGRVGRGRETGGCGRGGSPTNCICPQCGIVLFPVSPVSPVFRGNARSAVLLWPVNF